jgi:hypothetical protein
MAPVVHGLEQEWGDRINFAFLDIEDPRTEAFQRQLGFRLQPQFFLIDGGGTIVARWFGVVEAQDFEAAFQSAAP